MAFKVVVDYERCESNAMCIEEAPEVFDLDDDYVLAVRTDSPDESLREKVALAVRYCPKQALEIVDK